MPFTRTEPVPPDELEQKQKPRARGSFSSIVSTRDNCAYKWRTHAGILGCLEIPSEPGLKLHAKHYIPHTSGVSSQDAFEYCLKIWEEWELQTEFVAACDNLPIVHGCCFGGCITNTDATIKIFCPLLNKGWIKNVNTRLTNKNIGFKIDCFIWNWYNAIGKAETNILLIRFYEYSPTIQIAYNNNNNNNNSHYNNGDGNNNNYEKYSNSKSRTTIISSQQ